MKMPVIWTGPARAQLADLHSYLSESSILAADSQAAILVNAADGLTGFPGMGRMGRRRGTRELVVSGTPYIVVYRIRESSVRILAVVHGARRWPRSFPG
jgi:toxin ParE1/3/4